MKLSLGPRVKSNKNGNQQLSFSIANYELDYI